MGYIHILRYTASYRNAFFYPHGACFSLFLSRCFAFCRVCICCVYVLACVYVLLVLVFPVPGCVSLVTVLVWSGCVRCWLRDRFAWSCVCGVLVLLTPRDRVSGSCGLTVRCSRVVWSGVWATALAYLLYVFNTITL